MFIGLKNGSPESTITKSFPLTDTRVDTKDLSIGDWRLLRDLILCAKYDFPALL